MNLVLAGSGLILGLACDLPPPTDDAPVNPAVDPADGVAGWNGDATDGPSRDGPQAPADPAATDGLGELHVLIHDAPTDDVDEVWIRFDEVKVNHAELGWLVLSEEIVELDLLSLQGGVVETLGLAELPVGSYGQIRLHIEDAWVVVGAESFALDIPSGDTSGLKIGDGFELPDCGALSITLDWDAGAHLIHNPQGYELSPVIDVESIVADGDCGEPEPEPEPDANTSDGGPQAEPNTSDAGPEPEPETEPEPEPEGDSESTG